MSGNFENKELFETMPVRKALKEMAIPTIMAQLIVLVYNLADTFYVGRTNNPYMVAGASLILPVYNIAIAVAGLAGIGGGALVSRLLGVGKEEEARKVSSFCLYLAVIIAAFFSVGIHFFMDSILVMLGASKATYNYAKWYAFCVIVLGGIPTVISGTMANLLRSVGASKTAGNGIMLGGALNIVLDPIFMFIVFPDGKEVIGAGFATFISNCIVCLFFWKNIHDDRKISIIRFGSLRDLPQKKNILSIFSVGLPSAISSLLCDLSCVVMNRLAVGYGDVVLAAIGIVMKVERLPLNVGCGICQGTMPIVAYNYSSGNIKRMKETIRCAAFIGLLTAAGSIVIYEVFAGGILRLFIANAETIRIGAVFLRIRCLATPFMFLSFFIMTMFQGLGKGYYALVLGILRWGVFTISMLYILHELFGMYGIVWAQTAADLLTVTLSAFLFLRFEKRLKK